MFTRKHYIEIAKIIIEIYLEIPLDDNHCIATKYIDSLIHGLADYFYKNNNNFDRVRFLGFIHDGISKGEI